MSINSSENVLISVVTPVCNGADFVQQAYDSLLRQTCAYWEWVVVDDGSTDDTWTLLQQLAGSDSRVRCFRQAASGSAKQPRDHAVCESKGRFVVVLDADDRLADDYLEVMLSRQQATDADIVYPTMVFIDLDSGSTTLTLPVEDFDTGQVYAGRSLVAATVPEWRIGCNGGLYRRENWINSSWPVKHEPVWMNSDEVDERLYLINARRVAFAPARYYYQNHGRSITTRVSAKLFHTLITSQQLLDIIAKEYGSDSTEYRSMLRRAFCEWRSMAALYTSHHRELAHADAAIHQHLSELFARLDRRELTRSERLQFVGLCSFPVVLGLFCLKYSPRLLVEKAMQRLCPRTYLRTVVRRRTEKAVRCKVAASYTCGSGTVPSCQPVVVSMFCGNTKSGGLADRLRGAVSVYQACQQTERTFRLHFIHPFPLTDYLMPGGYDWRTGPDEVSFAKEQTVVLTAESVCDDAAERRKHKRLMIRQLRRNTNKQLHVYSNAAFCYDDDFKQAFSTLFRPTPRLEAHLDAIRRAIGSDYITVSARFCNLLDDFNEEVYSEPLPYDQRQQLIDACIDALRQLAGRHPEKAVVLCSDSVTFLDYARRATGCFVIEGSVSHIGNDQHEGYEHYEKTFLDFFTIARACYAYLLLGPGMHRSGFPYAAALSSGCPFDELRVKS